MGNERFCVAYAKTETTYGTDPTPVATDALLLAAADVAPHVEVYRRPVCDSLARPMRGGVAIPQSQTFTLRQELRGYGGGAYDASSKLPQYYHLLQACGLTGAFSVDHWTFTMPSKGEGTKSCTVYLYKDGLLYKGLGGRGNVALDLQLGKPAFLDYTLEALWSDPTAAAVPTPDYTTGTTGLIDCDPPVLVGATLDFDPYGDSPTVSQTGHVSNIKIDLRNNIEAVSGSTIGSEAVGIIRHLAGHGDSSDAGIALTFDVEYHDEGGGEEGDWWTRLLSQTVEHTSANLHLVIGNTDLGNMHSIQLGGLHLVSVSPSVLSGGRLGFSVEARVLGTSGSTSEDDFVLTAS